MCLRVAAGELIGVQYLYSQTGKVLAMAVPDTDDAAEEKQLVDEINLDEGLGEEYNDAEDLTLCGVDDVVSVPSTSAVVLSLTTVLCINMCSEQTDDFHAHEVSGSYSHCKT